jgi:hypothetical protein
VGEQAAGVGEQEAPLAVQVAKKYDRSFFQHSLIITTVRAIVKS